MKEGLQQWWLDQVEETNDGFSFITEIESKPEKDSKSVDGIMPVLPMRNMVLFPGVIMPVSVGRASSLKLVNEASKKGSFLAVVCQRDAEVDEPEYEDLHHMGVAAKVLRVLEMPDKSTTIIIQGFSRIYLQDIVQSTPYLKGTVQTMLDKPVIGNDDKFKAIVESCKDLATQYVKVSESIHPESLMSLRQGGGGKGMINFLCANLPIQKDEKMSLLEADSLMFRGEKLLAVLSREVQLEEMKMNIRMRTKEDIDQQQREYFLQQQIKTIQDELGNGVDQDVEEFRERARKMKWNEEVEKYFAKELSRLERLHPQSPDYSTQYSYLQTMIELPWGHYTKDNYNIANAERVLNRDHYGMEKVKERILEQLAVMQLNSQNDTPGKSPIICLYGPPGVGKTSLGKSIANALKRKYVRVSLGGVHKIGRAHV